MIDIDQDIFKLVAEITDRIENADCAVPIIKLNEFKLDCLDLIRDECPDVANHAISVGRAFCQGKASAQELENARIKCWQYLDKHNATLNTQKKKHCRIKAVIGALHADLPLHQVEDSLVFFVGMLARSGVSNPEIKRRLMIHFFKQR